MAFSKKQRLVSEILIGFSAFLALILGVALGLNFAFQKNIDMRRDFEQFEPALPTQILDRNGALITELFADEKRDFVPIDELPKHLIFALLSREDKNFYRHRGVDYFNFFRALINNIRNVVSKSDGYLSGFSTLTMQVAGLRHVDRTERSIIRKLKEIWYAYQIEKALTKNEILEIYMNNVYFGHNTNGVEAASQFYFGHSARDITLAESAILVIQMANPARFSLINHPEEARIRQIAVLNEMVSQGYTTREEADYSYTDYWANYNYERSNIASAYFDNFSRAPYFSEYVRLQLSDMLYGRVDINKDGYVVHTTLDLAYQELAESYMMNGYDDINQRYRAQSTQSNSLVDNEYRPIVELLALAFNLEDIRTVGAKEKQAARDAYLNDLNPTLHALSLMLGSQDLRNLTMQGLRVAEEQAKRTVVEGALITLENNTGHILAMVGGSDFETKKYNRATDALVMPGSAIKPLFYSLAISSRKFTTASRIMDAPIVFMNPETGLAYEPENFLGTWEGSVLLRYALASSMNVPALQVLEGIGFEPAIDRMSRMLGMESQKENRVLFPRGYPLALGVTAMAPINIARAFLVFPSQGREVEPIAIISVEDRQGNIILEPERDRVRDQQRRTRSDQILTPQEAYIMTDILRSSVEMPGGTLYNRTREVGGYDGMPMAGKTGTTQNWQDAWTVGFSPYVTTAIWFGFDTPGISLGRNLTGATAAGPIWARYMKDLHRDLERTEFPKPDTGLITVRVCSASGLLPTSLCPSTREEIFLTGTEPRRTCNVHPYEAARDEELIRKLQNIMILEDVPQNLFSSGGDSFLPPIPDTEFALPYSPEDFQEGSEDYNPLLD
ncbi:MAG: PBP1A family penicillin-binding protein [Spirochaetales bacterium]|jgi:penicillin-binding protein 1A|nr:PBP1A family penicillin-binding protein [Spirochaetales bacterium]